MSRPKQPPAPRPRLLLTMGDAAGVGPELLAAVLSDPVLHAVCRPAVVGDAELLRRAAGLRMLALRVKEVPDLAAALAAGEDGDPGRVLCHDPTAGAARRVAPREVSGVAGKAAADWLRHAADVCLAGGAAGLTVAHATLHVGLRAALDQLTRDRVEGTVRLLDDFLAKLNAPRRRVGVCALNPHGGEGGLFGAEEKETIAPAAEACRAAGLDAVGPLPADTLVRRAVAGEFDAVACMYHDQGHIPLRLVGWGRAVNVTLGLPIVRTSPSHGTAFDIAWRGAADPAAMLGAAKVAAELAAR